MLSERRNKRRRDIGMVRHREFSERRIVARNGDIDDPPDGRVIPKRVAQSIQVEFWWTHARITGYGIVEALELFALGTAIKRLTPQDVTRMRRPIRPCGGPPSCRIPRPPSLLMKVSTRFGSSGRTMGS